MKAIRVQEFGGPDVLHYEDTDDPKVAPGQIRIDARAAGVNPVDTYIRTGTYAKLPSLPYTPGTDAAGIVEAVGDGVTLLKPGDRVYTAGVVGGGFTGAYAEKIVGDAKYFHPLPDNVTFEQGAGVYVPYATAYFALWMRARGVPNETVLVHGASGGVGLAAVQLARAAGFLVVGTAGTEAGCELVLQEGAHAAYNHRDDGYLTRATDGFTGGKGFDIILEMLANVNLSRDLGALAFGGRVVVIGNRGTIEINPRDAMGRNLSILGMSLWNVTDAEQKTIHAALYAGLQAGTLRPVVGETFALADAPRAHEAILAQTGAHGKIVLNP